jgi:hypothetical protein
MLQQGGLQRSGIIAACFALAACGATAGSHRGAEASIDPPQFLLEVGGQGSGVLRRPERSLDELEAARREARGTDRRQVVRELVVALLFAAETAEGREARRLRRRAEELAEAAVRGSRDETLLAEMAFVRLWMSWRAGAPSAAQRAERFTDRYAGAGDLTTLAWMIRGELAFAGEDYDDAVTAYRFALGHLEHPLYGFALLRTAHSYARLDRAADATQALSEVEQLGCAREASDFSMQLASAAASERGTPMRRDTAGVLRPAVCEEEGTAAGGQDEEEGWRPAE